MLGLILDACRALSMTDEDERIQILREIERTSSKILVVIGIDPDSCVLWHGAADAPDMSTDSLLSRLIWFSIFTWSSLKKQECIMNQKLKLIISHKISLKCYCRSPNLPFVCLVFISVIPHTVVAATIWVLKILSLRENFLLVTAIYFHASCIAFFAIAPITTIF